MLTIDLAAIQKNWLKLASSTAASVAAVIKANAYGLGAAEVGAALYAVGCREFFLASISEAIAARQYLPESATIYALGGVRSGDQALYCDKKITPVLCSAREVRDWVNFNKSASYNLAPALKINTGMNRLGLDEVELDELLATPELLLQLAPSLLISHLSCADELQSIRNQEQCDVFINASVKLKKILPSIRLSLANSSGFFLGDRWHFDLVRPGAALYGINPSPGSANPMLPVVSLSLPIMQVRTLGAPAAIGYGATVSLPAGARLAVVAGGYADGLHRTLGARPEGILLGARVQSVGRISMDSTIFDISSVAAPIEDILNASIEVIGAQKSVNDLTQQNTSLGYEVLTSLGLRYKRQYLPGVL